MGIVLAEVRSSLIAQHPEQEKMLKPFLFGFDITYGEKIQINNTTLYAYMLKPETFICEGFGIDKEVLLAYSSYDKIEPRTVQAVNMLFNRLPFKIRVDTLNCFVVSNDPDVIGYGGITEFTENQARSIVPFVYSDIIAHENDSWYVRNQLRANLFDVDLFGNTLPLKDDSSFFGRQQVVARYIDAIKRGENRGVFGLRKTGKTSLLFKVDRIVRSQHLGYVFYYDCKSPSWYMD